MLHLLRARHNTFSGSLSRTRGRGHLRLAAWLAKQGYYGEVDPAVVHARLTAAPRGATGSHGAAQAPITLALVAVLTTLLEQITAGKTTLPTTPHGTEPCNASSKINRRRRDTGLLTRTACGPCVAADAVVPLRGRPIGRVDVGEGWSSHPQLRGDRR